MGFFFNALLEFKSGRAVEGMADASKGFHDLKGNIEEASKAMAGIGHGAKSMAYLAAPMAAGLGYSVKAAADLEHAMSQVQAILLLNKNEMGELTNQAKALGATTVFSAVEAAQGQYILAQAGFSMKEVVAALPGVLDAASASGVGLGVATDVVASQLRSFSMEADQAQRVADVLALTTKRTNTNFVDLAVGLKYAAPFAKTAGKSFEETAYTLGVLANAGIKGSIAGTAVRNIWTQLPKANAKALALFGGRAGFNSAIYEMRDGFEQLRPTEVIMANIAKAVMKAKHPLDAVRNAAILLGVRGQAGLASFQAQLLRTTTVTTKNVDAIRAGIVKYGSDVKVNVGDQLSMLEALRFELAGAAGTAKKMADIKLDNLTKGFLKFQHGVAAVAIEVGELALQPLTNSFHDLTDLLSIVAGGFMQVKQGAALTNEQMLMFKKNKFMDLLPGATEFARGFVEGFNELKTVGERVFNSLFKKLTGFFGGSKLTAERVGKLSAQILLLGAVAVPILGGIAISLLLMSGILSGVASAVGLVGAMISGVTMAMTGLTMVAGLLGITVGATFGLAAFAIIAAMACLWIYRDEIADWSIECLAIVMSGFTDPLTEVLSNLFVHVLKGWAATFRTFHPGAMILNWLTDGGQNVPGASRSANKSSPGAVGTSSDWLQYFGGETSRPPEMNSSRNDSAGISAQISQESVKGTQVSRPPSAGAVADAIRKNVGGSSGGVAAGAVELLGELTAKISGQDLNILLTKAKISQTERSGRMLDPKQRQSLIQDGEASGSR